MQDNNQENTDTDNALDNLDNGNVETAQADADASQDKGVMITISSESGSLPAYIVQPEGVIKGGVLVIHEVWGLNEHTKDIARRFAAEGYVALAPNLLSDTGINDELIGDLQEELFDPERRNQAQPKLRELMAPLQAPGFGKATMTKLMACFGYVASQPDVEGRIACVGYCFGGSYAYNLAVDEPAVKAVVPYYGHADYTVEQLKRITCPILAFYGENDENLITGLPKLKEDMTAAGVDYTAQVYPDSGHAFFNDTNKFAYNKTSAEDSWQKTLDFLAKQLV